MGPHALLNWLNGRTCPLLHTMIVHIAYFIYVSSYEVKLQNYMTFTRCCCDKALNPKSETFRVPDESRSRFSGCSTSVNARYHTSKSYSQPQIIIWSKVRQPLSLGGRHLYYGSSLQHSQAAGSIPLPHLH